MRRLLAILVLTITLTPATAQFTGLWEVTEVKVGTETMTPIGKWTRLEKDGTYQTGNGWLQNGTGTWNYDTSNKQLSLDVVEGIQDNYGPFTVRMLEDKMEWGRMEDKDSVVVTVKQVSELPKHTADKVSGLWALHEAIDGEEDIKDSLSATDMAYVHLRWDRVFVMDHWSGGRYSGIWHMNAHQPELTLIYRNPEGKEEVWTVSFNRKFMIWTDPEANRTRSFVVIHQVP